MARQREYDAKGKAVIEKAKELVNIGQSYGEDLTAIVDLVMSVEFVELRSTLHTINNSSKVYRDMSKLIKKALYALFDQETGFILTMDSLTTKACLPEQYAFHAKGTGIMLHEESGIIYYSQILSVKRHEDNSVYETQNDNPDTYTSINKSVETLVQKKYNN